MRDKNKTILSNQILKELELARSSMLELDEGGLVILSTENVAKVEAMIKTDSAYSSHSDESNDKSSASLFEKLKSEIFNAPLSSKLEKTSKATIYNIVCTLDLENGTRLSTDGVGREEISDRVSSLAIEDFINYLKNPEKLELFDLISKKTTYKNAKNQKHRTNQSFASKFCHYACFYLFEGLPEQDNYSIYDNVLKKVLPKYMQKYNICFSNKNENLNDYRVYRKIVDEIISKSKSNISRNGFDHLLWYYHKGKIQKNSNPKNDV